MVTEEYKMKDKKVYSRLATFLRLTMALTVCTTLLNCSEDLAGDLLSQRTPVEITASVEELNMSFRTRTATTGLNNGAFTISESTAMNKVLVHIGDDDHAYTFSGTTGDATNELTEDEVTYFPKDEASVNVYGHYPYSEGFSTVESQTYFTIQSDQTTDDGYLKSDLMTADNAPATRTKGGDGIWTDNKSADLDFKHQMAKIIVNVKTDESAEGGSGLSIKRVVINDVKPRVPITYNASTGQYEIGAATTDASGNAYDLQVLGAIGTSMGEATVLIPSQRYKVADADLTDKTVSCDFITIYASARYKDANQVEHIDENAELRYFFKGKGKLFRPGYVYTVTLRPGKSDYTLKDEYNVPGVELAKWANDSDDDEKTEVYVNAAEEKLELAVDKINTSVSSVAANKVYNGHEHTLTTTGDSPELTVTLKSDNSTLIEGDDYELHYSNNVNVGQATVTIMGIGRYAGNLEQHFTITPKSIADESVTISISNSIPYDGSSFQPTPIIHDSEADRDLTRYDYTTSEWTNNSNAGTNTASVKITGTGNYKDYRTETFSIPKAAGSVTFDDAFDTSGAIPTLTLIKPEGHEFDYIDQFKSILGDGKLETLANGGVVSSDNSVLEVTAVDPANDKWTFHVKSSGTVTLTFNMTNRTSGVSNYDYTDTNQPRCKIVITNGPALPIEYVSEYEIGSFKDNSDGTCTLTFAEDYTSAKSCWLSWYDIDDALEKPRNRFMRYLSQYGLRVDGVQYHLPSTYEWRSIFPGGCITRGKTFLNAVEGSVNFGVNPTFPRSTGQNVNDYEYAMKQELTGTWYSDFHDITDTEDNTPYVDTEKVISGGWDARPSTHCYALRFKGTTYCSAWLYEHMWTVDGSSSITLREWGADATGTYTAPVTYGGVSDTRNLTKNTVGRKTVVVRVIYLGPTVKDMTLEELKNLDWDDYEKSGSSKVIIKRFPQTGINNNGTDATYGAHSYNNSPAMEALAGDRPHMSWYWSGTPAPPSTSTYRYRSVRTCLPYIQGDQTHESYGFSVRMFKNYNQ